MAITKKLQRAVKRNLMADGEIRLFGIPTGRTNDNGEIEIIYSTTNIDGMLQLWAEQSKGNAQFANIVLKAIDICVKAENSINAPQLPPSNTQINIIISGKDIDEQSLLGV